VYSVCTPLYSKYSASGNSKTGFQFSVCRQGIHIPPIKVIMKPKLISEVLRQVSPRKYPNNRFAPLSRDSSPADSVRSDFSQRSRAQSIKRKFENSGDSRFYASAAFGNSSQPEVDHLDKNIARVKSICEKVTTDVKNSDLSPGLIAIFCSLSEAMSGICENQAKLASRSNWKPVIANPTAVAASISTQAKKPHTDLPVSTMVDLASLRANPSQPPKNTASAEDLKVKKFKEAVKDAERSTLIFKLNLGNVPIMNQNTMSTRAIWLSLN
jgi:hypothetical protein